MHGELGYWQGSIAGSCKQGGRVDDIGSYGGCMEGEVYNFNQLTTTCMDKLLAIQKAFVEKPHATMSMHLIEEQQHKKPVTI
jgi:hypothetical protein